MQTPDIAGLTGLRKVGEGGFGVVYAAHQPALDREVAVKVLNATADDTDSARRFRREATALGRLSGHPNIVGIYDILTAGDGRICLIMPFVTGGSLQDRVDVGPQSWRDVISDGIKVAGALQTAHDEGILHRDVKPDNILYGRLGEPQLADFGIARLADATTHTTTGSISATLAYAPPEIFDGQPPSAASDVYSLAATLIAALRGRPAFCDDSPRFAALLARIATEPAPDLRVVGVPDPIAAVLSAGMAKDPGDRPTTAALFGTLLAHALTAVGVPAPDMPYSGAVSTALPTVMVEAPAPPQPTSAPPRPRRRALAPTAGAIALVVILGAAVVVRDGWLTTPDDGTPSSSPPTATSAAASNTPVTTPSELGSTGAPDGATDGRSEGAAADAPGAATVAVVGVVPDDPSVPPGTAVGSGLRPRLDDRPMACGAEEPTNVGDVRAQFPGGPAPVLEEGADYAAVIETSCGTVTLDLLEDIAPQTVNSFAFLAREGFFEGLEIFRNATTIGALQTGGGDQTNSWRIGYSLPDELGSAESEGYPAGSVAMANAGPNTGGSQFFFVYDEAFDEAFVDNRSHAVFAEVTEGLEVLQQIGQISVEGETPLERVYMETVTIQER